MNVKLKYARPFGQMALSSALLLSSISGRRAYSRVDAYGTTPV
jgi:hypothetical protein